MFIFKLFTLNNIIFYFSYFIMFIFLFFLSYKYLYLEQSIYLLTNKLSKFEIEFNNPSVYSNSKISANQSVIQSAEKLMNDIFCDNDFCSINGNGNGNVNGNGNGNGNSNGTDNGTDNDDNQCIIIEDTNIVCDNPPIVNEIFDLKKEVLNINDDKISIISDNVGGSHATKKALMKLSIDKLKAKCEERKLSPEGTKNQLADKIIVHDNNTTNVEISDITE